MLTDATFDLKNVLVYVMLNVKLLNAVMLKCISNWNERAVEVLIIDSSC